MFIRRKNSVAIALASSFAVSALFAASARAATTVGDWENNNNEGWFDWTASNGGSDNGGNPGGTPATDLPPSVYSYTSEGATLGSSALTMAPPNGYNQNLSWKSEWENDSEGNSAMADVVNNTDFAIDVTYNAAEMAAVTYSSIYLTINFGSAGGTNTGFLTLDPTTNNPQGTYAGLPAYDTGNPYYPGGWDGTDYPGTTTRTMIWDYGDYVPAMINGNANTMTLSQLIGSNPEYVEFILTTNDDGTPVYHFDNASLTNPQINATFVAGASPTGPYNWGTLANWSSDTTSSSNTVWTSNTEALPSNAGDIVNFGFTEIPSGITETIDLNSTEEFQVNVGTLNFNNSDSSYVIAQGTGGTLTLNGDVTNYEYSQTFADSTMVVTDSPAQINDEAGNHTISAPVYLATNATIAVGRATDTFTISGNISGAAGTGITLAATGSAQSMGTVLLSGSNTYTGGTTVTGGTLLIGAAGALPANNAVSITGGILELAANTGGETLSSLSVSAGGFLDVGNNHVIISDPGGSIDTTIRGYLANGYNNGNWNGTSGAATGGGIGTSSATGTKYGIGYADGADGGISGITSGQLEVKYTLYGDANLDGSVNSIDFGDMAANFGKSGKVWDQGDFNYDGVVNSVDFGLLAGNFGKSAGGDADVTSADWAALDAFASANGLMADVPEPTAAVLAMVAGTGILFRRRRRQ
ncbi:MAG TPA: dockerin type I repeat-containing protein [Tepidisphaeraceae bacterium]|jgi:autotransporter-associated beta strand protein|nr:dockerin type I repeat-containing protein [Tepidisphaeraceae bacterium]